MVPSMMKYLFSLIPLALIAFGILYIVQSTKKKDGEKTTDLAIGIPLTIVGILWILALMKMG